MNSMNEMKKIIDHEFKNGLKGIRFFVEADASTDGFSHDFCALEKSIAAKDAEFLAEPCS